MSALGNIPEVKTIRYSEVLSGLSFALDLVEGQPEGHVVRSCSIGMALARRLGLPPAQMSALLYALLLKDAGCSSNSARVTALFGSNDFDAKRAMKTVDWSRLPNAVLYVARTVSPDGAVWSKARRFISIGIRGREAARELVQIRCERGAEISRLMGFPEETARAIRSLDEHWDGSGYPDGLKGHEIPLPARICGLAQTVEVFYGAFGPARAEEMARSRSGRWFDPELVEALLAEAREGGLWRDLDEFALARLASLLEPYDRTVEVTPERLDLTALAFARIIDAKSPFTYRHSEGVARAAVAMSERMGLPAREVAMQRRAALLHDIGKLGVSNSILDKPGRLSASEFAQIRRHPALTYGILSRVRPLQDLAEVAASHHEKLDGSGYHRGVSGEKLDTGARILAVADAFDALSQERPYRRAIPIERVLDFLRRQSGEKLCPRAVSVLEDLVSDGEL